MPFSLPTVRSGIQAIYPVVRRTTYSTFKARFINGTEQRWPRRLPCEEFVVSWKYITAADRAAIDAFYANVKGGYDNSATFTLGSAAYPSLSIQQETLDWVEDRSYPGYYSSQLSIKQTMTGGQIAAAGSASAYPTFTSGNLVQYGWSQGTIEQIASSELQTGPNYTFSFFGAGLSGFPTGPLRRWTLPYTNMPDADLATLEAFFIATMGMANTFTFLSPYDSTNYSNVRFDTDSLEITHMSVNQSSVTVKLVQTN